jgi:hypothetical protein
MEILNQLVRAGREIWEQHFILTEASAAIARAPHRLTEFKEYQRLRTALLERGIEVPPRRVEDSDDEPDDPPSRSSNTKPPERIARFEHRMSPKRLRPQSLTAEYLHGCSAVSVELISESVWQGTGSDQDHRLSKRTTTPRVGVTLHRMWALPAGRVLARSTPRSSGPECRSRHRSHQGCRHRERSGTGPSHRSVQGPCVAVEHSRRST